MTASSNKKSGFYIGVTCPGCGGGLELEDNFFAITCKYCGSALRVIMPDAPPAYLIKPRKNKREIRFGVDRYLKQNKQPLTGHDFAPAWIYYPYWKVDAVALKVQRHPVDKLRSDENIYNARVEYGSGFGFNASLQEESFGPSDPDAGKIKVSLRPHINTVAAGPEIPGLPPSIGLRAEYIKMHPYSRDNCDEEARYLPINVPWRQVEENLARAAANQSRVYAAGGNNSRTEIFRPTGSVVYFPYCIAESDGIGGRNRVVVDGLSGRVVSVNQVPEGAYDIAESGSSGPAFGELEVILHRCANCGVDLPANKSAVYICHNCQRIATLDTNLILNDAMTIAVHDEDCKHPLYPFWSFKISAEALKGFAAAYETQIPDRLIVPGFKMDNFEAMRKLTHRVTRAVKEIDFYPAAQYDKRFLPVTVGFKEAAALGEIVLYTNSVEKNPTARVEEYQINPEAINLIYLPFHQSNYFYVDSVLDAVTFEKSALA